jgi:hypothetical protein
MIPRPDGTFFIPSASSTQSTNIYVPWGTGPAASAGSGASQLGASIAGPNMQGGMGSGSISFQRPDGKFVVLMGWVCPIGIAATACDGDNVNLYDAGWYADGQYLSEQIQVPALPANTTLDWKKGPDNFVSFEVRTATSQANLATSSFQTIGRPGATINNAGGETWAQITVNFRRDFPVFDGVLNGAINGSVSGVMGAGGRAYAYRNVPIPTIYEFKLGSGSDLLDLQNEGLSMLRVTANGNVYSSSVGGFFSGGADLAENYTSTQHLEPGEVVMNDPSNPLGVLRARGQYNPYILGVVSTEPGFVAGSYTEDSFPIGLIGRVPVKISTENGSIKSGDPLTSASIAGYAMRATVSGRVLGRALEDFNEEDAVACPAEALGQLAKTKCGSIMMFVNLVDFNGQSVDNALLEWKIAKAQEEHALLETGTVIPEAELEMGGVLFATREAEVLDFLTHLKAQRADNPYGAVSEIFTDSISAVVEVITPELIANNVRANALTTNKISGTAVGSLEMSIEDKLLVIRGVRHSQLSAVETTSSTTEQVATALLALDTASTTEEIASSTEQSAAVFAEPMQEIVVSFDTEGNAFFAGDLIAKSISTGALAVSGPATFEGGLSVGTSGNASTTLAVMGDALFFGTPYFTSDTGGTALIKKGVRDVEVTFGREYVETPIVSASLSFGTTTDDALIETVLSEGVNYAVVKRHTTGFTIRLSKPAPEDMTFTWIALAIKDSKEFTSRTVEAEPVVPLPELIPDTTSTTTPSGGEDTSTSSAEVLPTNEPETILENPQTGESTVNPPNETIEESPPNVIEENSPEQIP